MRARAKTAGVPVDGLAALHLRKAYGGRTVLNDVSVSVQRGEAVALLGPNGAGKTTCFYIVMGLIQADYGMVALGGRDVTDWPMYRRARAGVGYLPQEASIFRGLSVADNILAVLEKRRLSRRQRHARLDELLDEFQVRHLRDSPALALSGGERRRVEIARAVASQPTYMLLDEPLAGIDPIAVADIRALVTQLKERGLGVLITDHNVRETLELVDRAYILHDGTVLAHGAPGEVAANSAVRRVYLGEHFRF